jgi:hypothetical protein
MSLSKHDVYSETSNSILRNACIEMFQREIHFVTYIYKF